ncbi:Oidioi.mRNA.OKI2018_I69.PAR.g9620.t1.cds [Oikopleura dioica]|uniref:Oidioi.mRNA.OKI2018_I69.PAR.g9620.t1.cds n=1 Tax=Oikopleura dioica TaxID=34765 RepID=A0ABN7RME1_OIKDI|nr:Oidioi.mRNA.OKI2018_I69.PAR.g9620.t1.cds [Oikopleura dioica]
MCDFVDLEGIFDNHQVLTTGLLRSRKRRDVSNSDEVTQSLHEEKNIDDDFAIPMSREAIKWCSGSDDVDNECDHVIGFQPEAHWLIYNRYFFDELDGIPGDSSVINQYRNKCGSSRAGPFPKLFRANDDMQSNFGIAIENFFMPPSIESYGNSARVKNQLEHECPNLSPSQTIRSENFSKDHCEARTLKSSDDWAGYTSAPSQSSLDDKTRCHSSHLCGYPIHCDYDEWTINETKNYSRKSRFFYEINCNKSMPMLIAFYLLMIMSISTYGNVLSIVTLVSKLNCPLKMRTTRRRHVKIKLSLTIADLIPAISLLPIMVYYVLTGYGNPSPSAHYYYGMVQESKGAVWVNVSGVLYIIYLVSTAANLSLLSTERFIALKFPLRNLSFLTDTGCNSIILFIWIISIFISIIPFLMYDYFGYSFDPQVFLNSIIIKTDKTDGSRLHGLFYVFCAFVGPYFYNLILCILTLVTVHKSMSDHRIFDQSQRYISTEREIANFQFFRVTAIMVVGFSMTLLPYSIILLLFVAGVLTCGPTTSRIFVFATFFSLSACVINTVVYNISSQNFQKEVLSLIGIDNQLSSRSRIAQIGPSKRIIARRTNIKTITSDEHTLME